jgi:hypothetical protein
MNTELVNKISLSAIQDVFKSKEYVYFDQGEYNLNLIGIRAENSISDTFDDIFCCAYVKEGKQVVHYWPCTTDPGKHYLENPLHKDGTAILVPNQYRGVYSLGIHGRTSPSGGYPALEQMKAMEYVRDNSKDDILNFELYRDENLRKKHIFSANIKSNIHRANLNSVAQQVGKHSAACQVIQSVLDYDFLISLVRTSINRGYKNMFTYTLIEERDFKNDTDG